MTTHARNDAPASRTALRLVCYCGKPLDKLTMVEDSTRPGHALVTPQRAISRGRTGRGVGHAGHLGTLGGRHGWRCRRCGADVRLTGSTLVDGSRSAVEDGRADVVLGVDL